MTLDSKEFEEVRALLPLYVKGLLTATETERVDHALLNYPALGDEIEAWKSIEDTYKTIQEELPGPSTNVFSRVTDNISAPGLLERFFQIPSLKTVIIFAQTLVIISLAVYAVYIKPDIRTLSSHQGPTAAKEIRINIIFKKGISEGELRNLLLQNDLKIVDGPYSCGLYIAALPNGRPLEAVIETLRRNPSVALAERTY